MLRVSLPQQHGLYFYHINQSLILSTTPTRNLIRYASLVRTGPPWWIVALVPICNYKRQVFFFKHSEIKPRVQVEQLAIASVRFYAMSFSTANWNKIVITQGQQRYYAQCEI